MISHLHPLRSCILFAALPVILGSGEVIANPDSKNVVLAENGKANFSIILGKEATLQEQLAAKELTDYFAKVANTNITTASSLKEVGNLRPIVFSLTKGDAPANAFPDESYGIEVTNNQITISAENPIGLLYGAYTLIEDALDVRWLTPGQDGESFTPLSKVELGVGKKQYTPAFVRRELTLTASSWDTFHKDTWEWMTRNRMQIASYYPKHWEDPETLEWLKARGAKKIGGGHILAAIVPREKYFDTHPEYFALIDGERKSGGDSIEHGDVFQPCTSHPDVVKLGVDYVNRFFEGTPPGDAFLLGNNDGEGWCQCANCLAQDDPEEVKNHSVSTRFMKYINAVSAGVLAKHPDKEMRAWGYMNFRSAPKSETPDPRLNLFVAMHGRCYRHSLDDQDCAVNGKIRDIISEWKVFPNKLSAREYYSCFIQGGEVLDLPAYVPFEDIVARDIKYLHQQGFTGWDDETPPPDGVYVGRFDSPSVRDSWQARFPMYYVAAKLLWEPNLDLDKLRQEVAQYYYGPAAKPMAAYRARLAKAWYETPGHFVYGGAFNTVGRSLNHPALEAELIGYLDQAAAAAAGDAKFEKRIAFERGLLENVWKKAAHALQNASAWSDVNAAKKVGEIKLDGVLNDDAWRNAVETSGFNTKPETRAKVQTSVKLLYDEDAIYFGFEVMEPATASLKRNSKKRDDSVWNDDSVELFIKPDGNDGYYHAVINPDGVVYDAKCVDGGFGEHRVNLDLQVATKILDDRWIAEIRLPAASLGAKISETGKWHLNVARNRRTVTPSESSTWADGGFHQINSFRPVVFGDRPPLIRNGGFEELVEIDSEHKRIIHFQGNWEHGDTPHMHPVNWGLNDQYPGRVSISKEDVHHGRYAWKVERGLFHQTFQAKDGDQLNITFWAKGRNSLRVLILDYSGNEHDGLRQLTAHELQEVSLENDWTKYEMSHVVTSPEVESIALAFEVREKLLIDDVSVTRE